MAFGLFQRHGNHVDFDLDKIEEVIEKAFSAPSCIISLTEEEQENYQTYLRIMTKLGWPAYINGDPAFHSLIIDLFDAEKFSEIDAAIYDYFGPLLAIT